MIVYILDVFVSFINPLFIINKICLGVSGASDDLAQNDLDLIPQIIKYLW